MQTYVNRLRNGRVESNLLSETLRSVYVGGGTPTVLPVELLADLLAAVGNRDRAGSETEFTIECNPGTLDERKARCCADAGVNRVSLGVQSFDPKHLRTLDRTSDPERVCACVRLLRDCGIENLNVDLIYGIPGQTVTEWEADLRRACDLGIQHLSTYCLTAEDNSRLASGLKCADDERAVAMWECAEEIAASYGLRRYEISNLAMPGHECRHNLDTWFGRTYVGRGPGASSFDGKRRWTNPPDLDAWLAGTAPDYDDLPPPARAAELLAFGLRTVAGWDRTTFRERTGFAVFALRGDTVQELIATGFLRLQNDRLQPTPRGLLFHDHVAESLL